MSKKCSANSSRGKARARSRGDRGSRGGANRQCRQSPRKVQIKGGAKGLTSYAGLLPVMKFMRNVMGFQQLCADSLAHVRGTNAVYSLEDAVELVIVGLLAGATSLLGVTHVWADTVLRRLGGWLRIPDDSNFGRLFKESGNAQVVGMESLNHRLRGRLWRRLVRGGTRLASALSEMWIDIDSTVVTVFGEQEGVAKGYNPRKKGAKSYHPLIAFSAETKEILQAWQRTGSAYTSNGTVEFLKQLFAHVPNKVRIVLRADSGFFSGEILDFLDLRSCGYVIKVKMRNLVTLLRGQTWAPVPKQKGWQMTEFDYQCGPWSNSRRFVVVRRPKQENKNERQRKLWDVVEYDYFCYVTTEALTPFETHKNYGKRATSETWIDEAKNQIGLAKLRTNHFLANAVLFQCAVLAYNIARWMAISTGNRQLIRWEIQSLRTFMIRVAGKLTGGSRQLALGTPDDKLYAAQWACWEALGS